MARVSEEVRVTARTLEKALSEAAVLLQVDKEKIDYRVVSQTGGGIFSFLGKKIEILARTVGKPAKQDRNRNRDRASASRDRGRESTNLPELSPEEIESLKTDLQEFCAGICGYVSGEQVRVDAILEEGRLVLDIDDEYLAGQITRNSKLAESLEHILRKKPRHIKRELPFRIFVDVRGLRRDRESELVGLARDLSEKVFENRRPIVLNYRSSYDRKIIHMALDKDERVYTKSIGSGPNRKLMILPIREKGEVLPEETEV